MAQRIVVVGSNSFSGSSFIDLLLEDKKNEIIGISRSPEKDPLFLPYKRHKNPKFLFYKMDLNWEMERILDLLDSVKPHYIVNFAAQSEVAPSWKNPEQWFQTNVVALAKLCNHLKDVSYLKKYIHISSPEIYGTCIGKVKENARLNPSTPYAASKAAADLFLFTLIKNFGFPAVIIRSTNVYGAHQQLFKIIPRSIIHIKLGKIIELHGGGRAIKSYIHIRDVSWGELAAMEKGKTGEIYNLSPEEGITVAQVVKIICRKMKVDYHQVTKISGERLGQDAAYIIDSTKARKTLGWRPKISLDQGTEEVISWIEENWEEIKRLPLEYEHKP